MHNVKKCINMHISLHGVLLKKSKEKERTHIAIVIAHQDKHIQHMHIYHF